MFHQFLQRAADGDAAAQLEICARYEKQVLIAARVLLGPLLRPHLDSVDIVQSVHRSLLAGLRSRKFDISSPAKLVALASMMARRKVARKWRKHQRQTRLNDHSSESNLPQLLASISSKSAEVVDIAAYEEQLEALCSHLNNIERTMLEMRLAGYTTDEVATHLNINPVAIRVRWSRLRARLEGAGIDRELL